MRDLNRDLKNLCRPDCDGSFASQHDPVFDRQPLAGGRLPTVVYTGMRTKHVEHMVERWHEDGISAAKSRMSTVRWLAEKIDK